MKGGGGSDVLHGLQHGIALVVPGRKLFGKESFVDFQDLDRPALHADLVLDAEVEKALSVEQRDRRGADEQRALLGAFGKGPVW